MFLFSLTSLVAFAIGAYTLIFAVRDRAWLWAVGCLCICISALYAMTAAVT